MNILHIVAMTMKSLPLFWYIWNVGKGILYEVLETWGKRFCSENCVENQMCWPRSVMAWFMVMSTWEEAFWTEFLCSRVLGMLQLPNLAFISKFEFQLPMSNNKVSMNLESRNNQANPSNIHIAASWCFGSTILNAHLSFWMVFSTFYNVLVIEFGKFAKLVKHT
jgi:hypothetical protein